MELFKIGFVPVKLVDLIDVTLVSLIFYRLYLSFRRTIILQVFVLMLAAYFIFRLAEYLQMELLQRVLEEFLKFAIIGVIIIFAPELKRILLTFVRDAPLERFRSLLRRTVDIELDVDELILAVEVMATSRTGALIVLIRKSDLRDIEQSGDQINAHVSQRLISSIFHPKSPLHDGAVLIKGNTITAARCVLPISDDPDLPAELGLRHRSALGITELTDAISVVVSEETGKVSVAVNGRLKRNLSGEELKQFLLPLITQE
jgi:diadenylate cyclase